MILVLGVYVAYTGLIKRETTKAIHAIMNFVLVFILSASFIAYAPDYIKKINDFSSDISNASLSLGTKIVMPHSDSQGKDSVDLIRDSLFSIQVQQPWLLLQYNSSDIESIGIDRVESLLKQKSEKGMLAFVGDGINDAPVLARADVGIAMGGLGSDAAIEAADVVLMTDEPSKIAAVMKIARKTIRIANQNIVFALGVKFLVLILGALGYANMWAAVFADVGVSIIAILNAIRAMRVKLPDMPAGSTNQG